MKTFDQKVIPNNCIIRKCRVGVHTKQKSASLTVLVFRNQSYFEWSRWIKVDIYI